LAHYPAGSAIDAAPGPPAGHFSFASGAKFTKFTEFIAPRDAAPSERDFVASNKNFGAVVERQVWHLSSRPAGARNVVMASDLRW